MAFVPMQLLPPLNVPLFDSDWFHLGQSAADRDEDAQLNLFEQEIERSKRQWRDLWREKTPGLSSDEPVGGLLNVRNTIPDERTSDQDDDDEEPEEEDDDDYESPDEHMDDLEVDTAAVEVGLGGFGAGRNINRDVNANATNGLSVSNNALLNSNASEDDDLNLLEDVLTAAAVSPTSSSFISNRQAESRPFASLLSASSATTSTALASTTIVTVDRSDMMIVENPDAVNVFLDEFGSPAEQVGPASSEPGQVEINDALEENEYLFDVVEQQQHSVRRRLATTSDDDISSSPSSFLPFQDDSRYSSSSSTPSSP